MLLYVSHSCWPPLEKQGGKKASNKPHANNFPNMSVKHCKCLYMLTHTQAPQMTACVSLEKGFSVLWPESGTSSFAKAVRIQSTDLFFEAKQPL